MSKTNHVLFLIKKIILIIVLIAFFVINSLSIASCQRCNNEIIEKENAALLKLNENKSFLMQYKYGDRIVKIDSDYSKEINMAISESEYIALEYKYLEIWENELEYLNDIINDYLSLEEKEQYIQITEEWKKYLYNLYSFEESLLIKDGVCLNGTSYKYLSVSDKKNAIRDRVIYINYLITSLDLSSY